MKLIAIEKELDRSIPAEYESILKSESRFVWDFYKQGFIREIYFTQTDHRAVIVLECASYDEAKNLISKLPLVKEKLIEFDILPLVPYDGFERLFQKEFN